MDDRLRQLLKELGNAINESISGSVDVNQQIQKIRREGYDLYVVLDATIGLGRNDEEAPETGRALVPVRSERDVQFRINVQDLAMLRSLGIDPTRKVKISRRLEPKSRDSSD